jgi:hypothetical protein
MTNHLKIRLRNHLVSWIPGLGLISELRRVIQAANIWRNEGWSVPPPNFVRRAMLLSEAIAVGAEIFVETGTFLGETSWCLKERFRQIHTIEVDPTLASLARNRFRKSPSVNVIEGDSAFILPKLCKQLDAPCLFFLDGHYSGGITGMGSEECPILEELRAIFNNVTHPFRIVIDDARLFGSESSYPAVSTLEKFLAERENKMRIRIENDAILIS